MNEKNLSRNRNRLLLDPDHPGPVVHAGVEVDSRRRFTLPAQIRSKVDWLSNTHQDREALAVLAERGQVKLLPWKEASSPILKRRKELIERARVGSDLEAIEALKKLEDRYKVFTFPKDELRPTIPVELIHHLGIELNPKGFLHIYKVENSLEFLSQKKRDELREAREELLPDLP